jgi:AcrR family transcriptional regulator
VGEVNSSRGYSSPLRRAQAEATRGAVLDAARDLFLERGYGATTVDQVAERAGVSKPTVFSAVGNKQMLLRTVRDIAIAGDDEPVPVSERPLSLRIRAEPDRGRAIELLARHLTGVAQRYGRLYQVLRAAAESGEPDLREVWEAEEQERLVGARVWIDVLARKDGGPTSPGFGRRTAVDVLWLLMAPDHFNRFVHQRGWTAKRYQRWLAKSINALFAA